MDLNLPLQGVRVLELGQFVAGPYAARLFAEFGAEVIKVEPPGSGDPLRLWRARDETGTSLWWYAQSRNKKSVTLDLRQPEGQELCRRLAARCDLVIENFRPGTLERWNLGWEQIRAVNPRAIMLRISGFGQTGPYRDRPGFGSVGETMGGIRYLTGWPDRPPTRVGLSLGDSLAALYGVVGALMALRHRDATGQGQYVDVALYEAVFALTESMISEYDRLGAVWERSGNIIPGIAPTSTYPTADGKYIAIGGNSDSIFPRLMRAIGREDLATDPTLRDNAGRAARQAWLDEQIEAWTSRHSLAECQAALEAAAVPHGPIYSAADIARDPQYAARGMLETVDTPTGPLKVPGIVPRLSATPGVTLWAGPPLGAHNQEVYGQLLGLGAAELAALQAQGVI